MCLSKNIRYLRKRNNYSQDFIAEKLGYKSYTTIQKWEMGISEPSIAKLRELADLFGVDINDLTTKNLEKGDTAPILSNKDERDIKKDLDSIINKLTSGEEGPASYDGEELDSEAAELFRDELEIALRRLKIINKEKYTPKKYKK